MSPKARNILTKFSNIDILEDSKGSNKQINQTTEDDDNTLYDLDGNPIGSIDGDEVSLEGRTLNNDSVIYEELDNSEDIEDVEDTDLIENLKSRIQE